MKVGVFVLNYLRPESIKKVLDSISNQTIKPEVVYVWNNNPDTSINFPNVININSQENFLCFIRHAVAVTRNVDYWVFIDDDVVMKPGVIANFLKYNEKYPESILGYYGRNIVFPQLYSLDQSNFFTNQEREVDIVLGMIHFCRRDKLFNPFILKKNIPSLSLDEDDIVLSLGNKYIDNAKNYVIPGDGDNGVIPLADKTRVGLSAHSGHSARRKECVKLILEWARKLPEEFKKEHQEVSQFEKL